MADPAQLWKCESKQQAPVATRNPMWGFLKGLEGFDTERARECLVRLLDKHYDTIAVLKLATKRDLIEDAGILPGDALRIVTAAKEYVAPRDPSPEPPTSQRDHASTKPVQGVEHRQDAYRPPALRETTVLSTPPGASQSSNSLPVMQKVVNPASQQEAGKGVNQVAPNPEAVKGVNQVAPNPEAVKGVNQVAPKPEAVKDPKALVDPTLPPPWRALVDGNTGYIYYWNPVTNITQYSKPSPLVAPGPPFPSGPPPASVTSGPQLVAAPPTIPVGITYPHTCRLCDAQCISEVQFRSHYSGQRHNAAVREAKQPAQIPKPVLNPAVKETKETAQPQVVWGLKQPSQTQQVASWAEQPSQSTSVARVHACGVCNVQCGNEFVLRSHFNGKKHARKMELATESKDNRPTEHLYCSICDVTSSSKKNLVMHFNGKRHAENMKEYSDSGDSSYYTESEIEF